MNNLGMQLEVLSAADVQALEPNAFKTIAGALFNRDDACLHVPDFVAALANTAKSEGVEISEHTPVRNITRDGNVLRVKTSAGDVFPKTVVVACGAWSGKVLAPLGIHLGQQPAKGYSITMRTPDAAPKRPVLLSEGRVAVTPLGEKIRFAGILDLVGMNTALSRERLDAVLRTVGSYVNIGKGEVVEEWAGLRSCTPDGIPSIGRIPSHPDIIVACGHGHIGMGLAPVTGRLVAQIAAGDEPEMDLRPLAIDRFQRRAA
jgi:D-amino-acid dehydrogenase